MMKTDGKQILVKIKNNKAYETYFWYFFINE